MMIFGCANREEIQSLLHDFYEQLGQNQIFLSDTESRTISASAGYAWTDNAQAEIAVLLSHADEALYKVKRDTKGNYREY